MNSENISAPSLDLKLLKDIDLYMEEFYPQAKEAGEKMAEVKLAKAQIRNLETIITSVTRFSEVINYIKNQAGKDKSRKDKTWILIAPLLLGQLEQLEKKASQMANNNPEILLDIKMRLARVWAKQVVAQYLYLYTAS